jgi:hypothetical protein
VITEVTGDRAYRELSEQLLRGAFVAAGIDFASVEFGERDEADYSWLFFVVDPESEDHFAAHTITTAGDLLVLDNPNGILRERGSRLAARILKIELTPEASLTFPTAGGGERVISPRQEGLAAARVGFTYRQA